MRNFPGVLHIRFLTNLVNDVGCRAPLNGQDVGFSTQQREDLARNFAKLPSGIIESEGNVGRVAVGLARERPE